MPISAEAARHAARDILPDCDPAGLAVSLAASLIVRAVEHDEAQQRLRAERQTLDQKGHPR